MLPFPMPRWAWFAIGAVLLALAFYIMLDRYGDARYREGKQDADAAWQAASAKLIDKAHKSAGEADTQAAAEAAEYAAKVEAEKERIDEHTAKGGSPFDVMFGG